MTTTLDYYAQTKPSIPAQLGALTLFQAAELSDAISCIRTVCQHVYQTAGHELPERHAARLQYFNGATLSLAKAKRIISLWIKWTGRSAYDNECPSLVTVESFLFGLRELNLS
jgi:hypothetical protein